VYSDVLNGVLLSLSCGSIGGWVGVCW